jgi:microcystin degradation protein MlrC
VRREAYEQIAGEMVARLNEALPVDGVYLDLHGAMVAEHCDDGEGELAARLQRGEQALIVISLICTPT